VETDFPGLMEFTNRQILITRIYEQKIWGLAAGTHVLYCLTLLLGALATLSALLASLPAFQIAALTFLPILLSSIRGAMRMAGVMELLPGSRAQIASQGWIYIILGVFISFLYVANFASSVISRRMRWRGVVYELISPEQTRILSY
jgi:ceramide glucosyltransferase